MTISRRFRDDSPRRPAWRHPAGDPHAVEIRIVCADGHRRRTLTRMQTQRDMPPLPFDPGSQSADLEGAAHDWADAWNDPRTVEYVIVRNSAGSDAAELVDHFGDGAHERVAFTCPACGRRVVLKMRRLHELLDTALRHDLDYLDIRYMG